MSEFAIEFFCESVQSTIKRCRDEWDMSYCEIIGCLEMIKANMITEAFEDE